MAKMLEIAQGISKILANSHDGATDTQGDPLVVGLKREEGHPIHDSRVMDGFSACIKGDSLRIYYHTETRLKEVHNSSFESDVESMIEKVKKHLAKEYKSVTGKSLSLGESTEVQIMVEYISRIRTSVRAYKDYKISGSTPDTSTSDPDRVDPAIQKWVKLGGLK